MTCLKHKLFRLALFFCIVFFTIEIEGLFAYETQNQIVGLEDHHRWKHRWGNDEEFNFYSPYPQIHNRTYRPYRFSQSYYPECGYVWQNDRYVSQCEE